MRYSTLSGYTAQAFPVPLVHEGGGFVCSKKKKGSNFLHIRRLLAVYLKIPLNPLTNQLTSSASYRRENMFGFLPRSRTSNWLSS